MLEVDLENNVLGKGTFGSCFKGKYKGIDACLKFFFNEEHFVRSILINEAKAMLNLIPHSSFPLFLGVCMENLLALIRKV